ncbi:MAG: glycosyltransferase [Clostridia bacterium]|nr:glycosyltransferase [Clostridia bacterium]
MFAFIGYENGAFLRVLRILVMLDLLYMIYQYHNEIDFSRIAKVLSIALGISFAYALLMGLIPDYKYDIWYKPDGRFMGLTTNPNNLAMICMFGLILVLTLYMNNRLSYSWLLFGGAVCLLNGMLTKGKAFLLVFTIAVVCYFIYKFIKFKKKELKEFVVFILLAAVLFAIFNKTIIATFERFFNDYSGDDIADKMLTGRFTIWREYMSYWVTSWQYILCGCGLGVQPHWAGPHSDFIYLLFYFGVFGSIIFIGLVTMYVFAYYKHHQLNKNIIYALILLIMTSFSINVFCTEFVFLYILAFSASFAENKVVEKVREVIDYNSVDITKTQKTKMKISVLMSVYKNDIADNVELAIQTILNQTYKPSQIVIVRDGIVGDDLQSVLDKYKQNKLFTIIERDENLGLGKTLAQGTKFCKYDYIARMDADDVCVPTRFEKQIKCFIVDESLSIVGSNGVEFVNTLDNLSAVKRVPQTDEEIKEQIKSRCPMCHMSVMMKKQALIDAGGYQDWYYAEDWYLWVRMCLKGVKFYNIQENLMLIRINEDTYGRRHGMQYFRSIKGLLKFIHKNKLSNFIEYFKACCIRFVGHVLVPQKLKTKLFKKYLRDGEIDNDTKDYSLHLAGQR